MKLDAKQLRVTKPSQGQMEEIQRNNIWIILDNVLDTYNIGSIFRLADAVAAKELILCGGTERPPSSRIHKAAVGTEEWVKWRYFDKTTEAITKLREENPQMKVVAVEQDEKSLSLFDLTPTPLLTSGEGNFSGLSPIAVVVGHETEGVSLDVLNVSDTIVEIPMWGVNKSLNVVVSTGIVLYRLLG